MARLEHNGFITELELQRIEMLNGSFNIPPLHAKVDEFKYKINLESKADAANKLIIVVVAVDVKNEDQTLMFGSLCVSCIFRIENFEEIIQTDAENKLEVPQPVIDLLNTISVSMVRGIMFSTFRGTFLHNAFLPVITAEQLYMKS
jgi:hypothetical protein